MASGLEKTLVRIVRSVIDSYMEGFETAFPAVVKSVNKDGTVDVTPSIRNTLKNMQIEPDGKDEKPLPVESVPVLWPGTASAIVKFELKEGDPLLCVSSSRDLRAWVDGGEDNGPYDPKSFSGNDLNDLVAVPLSRGGEKKVTVEISHDGKVNIEADSISMKASDVNIEGDLGVKGDVDIKGDMDVDGEIGATGDVSSDGTVTGTTDVKAGVISLMTHVHSGGTIEGMTGTPVP